VFLYAHRGSRRRAPENTLLAFRLAIAEGADGVELDVRTCASGEVVVSHDAHLGRVADRAAWVAKLPLARLRALDLGGGERLPLLDEAIDLVVSAGLRLNVEVKGDVPDRRETARLVASTLMRRQKRQRDAIVLSTFDPTVFRSLARAVDRIPLAFLFEPEHGGTLQSAFLRRALRPDGLHPHHSLCTHESVARWKRRGVFVAPWTVNDPARARALEEMGVDAIITDDVPLLRGR
jgi:glycerophosphoryl diester phosphodiesterase